MIGEWRLQEVGGTTAYDEVGSNDGTSGNTIVRDAGGMFFNATDDIVTITAVAAINEIFAGGGTIVWRQVLNGRGESNLGTSLSKGFWFVASLTATSMRFVQTFSGIDGVWTFDIVPGKTQEIAITYDSGSTANDPLVYIDGISVAVTQTGIPTETATLDAANNFIIGNNSAGERTFEGSLSEVRMYDEILTAGEIRKLSNRRGVGTPFGFTTKVKRN
jgi:hypothetical protein